MHEASRETEEKQPRTIFPELRVFEYLDKLFVNAENFRRARRVTASCHVMIIHENIVVAGKGKE